MGAARDSDRGWSPAYQGIPFEPMSLHFLGVSSAIFSSVSFFIFTWSGRGFVFLRSGANGYNCDMS